MSRSAGTPEAEARLRMAWAQLRLTRVGHAVRIGLTAALMVACGAAAATTYVALTVAEMVEAADIAILAEVQDVAVFERDGYPWTRVTFAVERDLIAEAAADASSDGTTGNGGNGDETAAVELAFLGGSLSGGASLAVAGMPGFDRGERVLVLAYEEDGIASPVVGFRQGLWRVTGDSLVDEAGRVLGLEDGELVPAGTPTPVANALDALIEQFGDVR